MNISEVKIKLLGSDILSIINEFVKVEGLTLTNVSINNGILLEGNFKKRIKIEFEVKVELIECAQNKINFRVVEAKILNLGVFRIFRSFALKQFSKLFKQYGVYSQKDRVIVEVNTVLKDVPFVDFNIDEIFMKRSELWVEASDVNISIAGNLIKQVKVGEANEEDEEERAALEITEKIEDSYSKGRKIIEDKLPEFTEKYKEYIFILPDVISLIYRLLKDRRVPIKTKLIMSAAIGYVAMPTNIIPNKIPFIGAIDEIGVILFALDKVLKDVPLSIIVENWEGRNDLLIVLQKGVEYLMDFTKARNVEKLCAVIEELSTL
jgi:uncharacterized membrane protein YkvA (DUF1232 family)